MPASVVTVPEVPSSVTPPLRISCPMQWIDSKDASRAATSSTIAAKPSVVKPALPQRSASVTTPTGSES